MGCCTARVLRIIYIVYAVLLLISCLSRLGNVRKLHALSSDTLRATLRYLAARIRFVFPRAQTLNQISNALSRHGRNARQRTSLTTRFLACTLKNEHCSLTPATMPYAAVCRPQERGEAGVIHIFWADQFRYDCERDLPAEGARRGGDFGMYRFRGASRRCSIGY